MKITSLKLQSSKPDINPWESQGILGPWALERGRGKLTSLGSQIELAYGRPMWWTRQQTLIAQTRMLGVLKASQAFFLSVLGLLKTTTYEIWKSSAHSIKSGVKEGHSENRKVINGSNAWGVRRSSKHWLSCQQQLKRRGENGLVEDNYQRTMEPEYK